MPSATPGCRTAVCRAMRRAPNYLGDEARFIRNWFKNPLVTGAVSPSGRALARMMARCVDPLADGPVIELGPGTGPVTEALILHGVAPQRLILVEYDGDFCRLLARRFPLARVIQGDAYDLRKTLHGVLRKPANAIVSCLPLLTKPEAQRATLLRQALDMAAENAPFIQFTYGAIAPVPRRRSSSAFACCGSTAVAACSSSATAARGSSVATAVFWLPLAVGAIVLLLLLLL